MVCLLPGMMATRSSEAASPVAAARGVSAWDTCGGDIDEQSAGGDASLRPRTPRAARRELGRHEKLPPQHFLFSPPRRYSAAPRRTTPHRDEPSAVLHRILRVLITLSGRNGELQ